MTDKCGVVCRIIFLRKFLRRFAAWVSYFLILRRISRRWLELKQAFDGSTVPLIFLDTLALV